ncbi:MAG: tryptophan-rich sensory protein [Candidatus Nanoarchaeia archaeon]|nr:tryptophan-rich sensory protein [Candidatus Nanoarchaeia archaeon]
MAKKKQKKKSRFIIRIRKTEIDVVKLILAVVLPLTAGFIGSYFTYPEIISWYNNLNKTPLTPPNSIFGPVWTTLYILMGVAFYLIWKKGIKDKIAKQAVILFVIQLGLNSLWSILFFGLHKMFLAFVEILLLWGVILATMLRFRMIDKRAFYLMIPYLAWVTFAAGLNLATWMANPVFLY